MVAVPTLANSARNLRHTSHRVMFQSAIIAGAYGSGRELAEFFLPFGPRGGLAGMVVTTLVFSLVLAASFEFARRFQLFDPPVAGLEAPKRRVARRKLTVLAGGTQRRSSRGLRRTNDMSQARFSESSLSLIKKFGLQEISKL